MFKHSSTLAIVALAICGLFSSISVFAKAYKGAEIYSNETHQYGRYVMRMQVAKGSGVLSTFFTYKNGSEQAGAFWEEIDLEVFGKNDAIQWQSNIIQGQPRKLTEGVHTATQSLGDAYHTYAVEWTPSYVAWFVDGQEIRRITGGNFVSSLTSPQGMRFNLWAATAESWVGAFSDTILPVYQFVNYFEYYSYDTTTNSFNLLWRDDFNNLNTARWGLANWTFNENRVDFSPDNIVVKEGVLVLALTHESATGFSGNVPVDNGTASSSSISSLMQSSTVSSSVVASSIQTVSSSAPATAVAKSSSGGGAVSFSLFAMLLLLGFIGRNFRDYR